jgi:allantoin racemase
MPKILVVNPNSNESVTEAISAPLETLRRSSGFDINCRTLEEAPFGIESQDDIQAAIPLVVSEISRNRDFDAFVIACYSDPGLAESSAITDAPVFGIHESAVRLMASRRNRFGVLALGQESIQRHIAYIRQLGLAQFHAAERPLHITVDEGTNDPGTLQKIIRVGRKLVDEDGAESLLLGCAGLAMHRRAAQDALGVPVVDPTEAAVTRAIGALSAL